MASTTVEAKSLSFFTNLAANPPASLKNASHPRQDPLVLYIARVPGSRDVFLTPMKPRDKVVSAEDVQSSLYFLHVDLPEDAHLVEPQDAIPRNIVSGNHASNPEMPPAPPVHRRPVSSVNSSHGSSPSAASYQTSSQPGYPNTPPVTKRKPVPGTLEPRSHSDCGYDTGNNVSRGLSGPTSVDLDQMLTPGTFMPQQSESDLPMLPPRRYSEQPPLPPRPNYYGNPTSYQDRRVPQQVGYGNPKYLDPSAPPQAPPAHRSINVDRQSSFGPPGTTLTLIRRDPGSGEQWNVAKIADPPVLEVSSSTLRDPSAAQKKAGAPMFIDMLNSGYCKFSEGSATFEDGRNNHSERPPGDVMPMGSDSDPMGKTAFTRRLWMEGSKYLDRSFGHRKINSSDSRMSADDPRSSSESWGGGPHGPINSSKTPFSSRENQSYSTIQVSDRKSTFRGYVFLSPWNGRCEFSTGGGGGSLKCKHVLPSSQGGAMPMVVPASELRFNLPSTTFMSSTPRAEDGASKRSSFFGRPHNQRSDSSVDDTRHGTMNRLNRALDRMDLSLGQESAGGGFGGKQAKLGKLIIDDEGFKMVDLLVAANLALWWRAYERIESKSR